MKLYRRRRSISISSLNYSKKSLHKYSAYKMYNIVAVLGYALHKYIYI